MDKFSSEFFGYNRQEVKQFVNEVIERKEKLVAKITDLEKEIKALREQNIHYQTLEVNLRTALENATKDQEQKKKEAYVEAQKIIKEARNNADRIISDALVKTEKLEQKNISIERDLKKVKNRLRTIVEQQIDIVDEIEDLEMDE